MTNVDRSKITDNRTLLKLAIEYHNITRICVEFAGCGDSGAIDSIEVWTEGDLPLATDKTTSYFMPLSEQVWEPGKGWRETKAEKPKLGTLHDLIEVLVYERLRFSGVDWYNNDGGFGQWLWTKDKGVEFEVNYNYMESRLGYAETGDLLNPEPKDLNDGEDAE